jgi:hypothetical protein
MRISFLAISRDSRREIVNPMVAGSGAERCVWGKPPLPTDCRVRARV